MTENKSILIVDRSEDAREVLRTVLERRGLDILEATSVTDGLVLAHQHQPQVIVLDIEHEAGRDEDPCQAFVASGGSTSPSLVILGRVKVPVHSQTSARSTPVGQILSKPYHYGPLIRKIEELLV